MNNQNKQFFTLSVADIKNLVNAELDRIIELPKSNTNRGKNLTKNKFMLHLLDSMPNDILLSVDGVRGNGDIRAFYLVNYGSVVECIVKYHQRKEKQARYEKSLGAYDSKVGCLNVEIKTSLSPNALATPSEQEFTILVNHLGVFMIAKNEVLSYTNKQNRLPYNQECGYRVEWLSEALGL